MLPVDDGSATQETASTPVAPAEAEGRHYPWALVLEDNASLRGLLQQVFESLGIKVIACEEADSLLDAAAILAGRNENGLCVFDVTIEGGPGGLDVAGPVRKLLPHSKIILSSGHSDQWEMWQTELSGLDVSFLPKPFSIKDLRRIATVGG